MVGMKRVVSPGSSAPSGSASVASRVWQSASRTGWCTPPWFLVTPPSHLQISLPVMHFSRSWYHHMCSSYRESTCHLYHTELKTFCGWCSGRKKEPLHPFIQTVLNYLQYCNKLVSNMLWPLVKFLPSMRPSVMPTDPLVVSTRLCMIILTPYGAWQLLRAEIATISTMKICLYQLDGTRLWIHLLNPAHACFAWWGFLLCVCLSQSLCVCACVCYQNI